MNIVNRYLLLIQEFKNLSAEEKTYVEKAHPSVFHGLKHISKSNQDNVVSISQSNSDPQVISSKKLTINKKNPQTTESFAKEIGTTSSFVINTFHRIGKSIGIDDEVTVDDKKIFLNYLRAERKSQSSLVATTNLENLQNNASIKEYIQEPASHEKQWQQFINMEKYRWPCKFNPFSHQIATTKFLISKSRAFCLNDMGTGKTLSVLWAYDYLRLNNMVKRALIICPLSTMRRTWGDEVQSHLKHLRVIFLHGTGEERRKLINVKADLYVINHDGIKVDGILDALSERNDIDLVVIDEIAQIARNAGTDRWRALNTILNKQHPRWAWGLTGTPIPNSPADAWAQCRLISPDSVSPYYSRFRDSVLMQIGGRQWIPKPEALEIVSKAMQPSIRYSREECIDLPPVTHSTREVALTREQTTHFTEMLSRLKTEADSGAITAFNEAIKVTKLIQIACGAAYTDTGDTAFIPSQSRLLECDEIIEESGASVIVFTPFRGVLESVASYLSKKYEVGIIHGKISSNQRDTVFTKFQNDKSIRVLVAQPSAMSHGLTLTAANTIIWFGPIYDNDTYQQANARISRPGQTLKQHIVHLEGSEIERRVYRRLKEKQNMQGILLELLAEK